MNVKLLRKIKEFILEEPRRFYMWMWAERVPTDQSPCGTTQCIAGAAVHISHPRKFAALLRRDETERFGSLARRELHISADQALALFHVDEWPERFRIAYLTTTSKKEEAKIAAKRIDHFIRTGK
jgi:hypothetical protein